MKKISKIFLMIFITLMLFILASCSPKEQITVFDSNVLKRNAAETESIRETVKKNKETCKNNKEEIEGIHNAMNHSKEK